MLSRVVLSFPLLLASICSQQDPIKQVSAAADALLARAGASRPVYERAWHKVDEAERQGYEFLLAHMPKRDFAQVHPALLLENVRLAQAVRVSTRGAAQAHARGPHLQTMPFASLSHW